MPDDAAAPVAIRAGRLDGRLDRCVDRPVLVILGDALRPRPVVGSSLNTMKFRRMSRNRAWSKTPLISTSSAGRLVTTSRPSIVFHGA